MAVPNTQIVLNSGQVRLLRSALQRGDAFAFTTPFTGVIGPAGPAGPAGPGVPTGGNAGDVLTKNSGVDFDDSWLPPSATGSSRYASLVRYGGV